MNEELKIEDLTPMMQKYLETKQEYPDCILFYRLGDFYEMFFEDALTASRELEITLFQAFKRTLARMDFRSCPWGSHPSAASNGSPRSEREP